MLTTLNAEKCRVLRITRKRHKIEYPYKLHDAVLESTIHELNGIWECGFPPI